MAENRNQNRQNSGPPPQNPSPETPPGLREFIAETDCIYKGSYVAAGTRIRAAAQAVPHFRAV
jgi:hypothetical protein